MIVLAQNRGVARKGEFCMDSGHKYKLDALGMWESIPVFPLIEDNISRLSFRLIKYGK